MKAIAKNVKAIITIILSTCVRYQQSLPVRSSSLIAVGVLFPQRVSSRTTIAVSKSFLHSSRSLIYINLTFRQNFLVRGGSFNPNRINTYNHNSKVNITTISSPLMCLTTDPESQTFYDKNQSHIWDGSDKNAFHDESHPGYAIQSDPSTQVGGWLAHRIIPQSQNQEENENTTTSSNACWIKDEVASKLTRYNYTSMPIGRPPKILVLYGSLRPTSFSRKLAYEFSRLLEELGCDVRTYNPKNLPVRDPELENHAKVKELRALTHWSDGHVWVSPEMHGTITGTFKNRIDWIPLNTGSVRPTQGKTCLVAQVNGGSQSFNAVNALRLLARWMRMPCCTNQSSVAKAWKEFDDFGRMKDSSFRERVVDCAEEFAKFSAIMAPVSEELTDRYSERKEKEKEGRLLSQAEKETKKTIEESRKG